MKKKYIYIKYILYILFYFVLDTKKISDWSYTNSIKTNYSHELTEQPEVINNGPIDLNQLIKSKNDAYLKHLINPKCFPTMVMTPSFGDNALVEQIENAPFNIINLPITMNEPESNDV